MLEEFTAICRVAQKEIFQKTKKRTWFYGFMI
jgi:hypothetical protein